MSGNSATQNTPAASTTGFPGQPTMYTMPAAPPGMMEALAAQMAQGYGGDQSGYLNQVYQPVTFPSYQPLGYATPAPATPVTPATTTPSPDNGYTMPDNPWDVARAWHPNMARR